MDEMCRICSPGCRMRSTQLITTGLLPAQDSEPPELCQPPAQRLNSPTDRCGVGAGPLEVPVTLLACAEEVIEWGAECCRARVRFVEGFGCRPIATMRLAPWPASESLQ